MDDSIQITFSTSFPPAPSESASFFSGEKIYPLEGEEDSSFYREFPFTTDPSGNPIKVFSLSGTLLAGKYPINIFVEGKTVKQLFILVSYKSNTGLIF